MATAYLALESVSYVLPDGRTLFSELTEQFDTRPTGVVGRNGVGKTILARLLAGRLEPAVGRCVRRGTVHYLDQRISTSVAPTVAALMGVDSILSALDRIETGSCLAADFEAVGERWDIRHRLQTELALGGLDRLRPSTRVDTLSGGEAMRVALIGAYISDADFLILDEPSNHLDREARHALIEQLKRWKKGLLVVSHDRLLLDSMARIVELTPSGLHSYGGNHSFYETTKALARERAALVLDQSKQERRRQEQALREQHDRQSHKQAVAGRQARDANQAKILLGRRKERSEGTEGKQRQHAQATREMFDQRVREAAKDVENGVAINLRVADAAPVPHRQIAALDQVILPFAPPPWREISLSMTGPQRIGVVGPNGCGKSTLLKVLAGELPSESGRCVVAAEVAYLDQALTMHDPMNSPLEHMTRVNDVAEEGIVRMWLAQLGLDAAKVSTACAELSGGERLKVALACALYSDRPAQLVLLDEPGNHLDLASLEALEAMLRQYTGALIVASHDDVFLNRLALTHRLEATDQGWRVDAW